MDAFTCTPPRKRHAWGEGKCDVCEMSQASYNKAYMKAYRLEYNKRPYVIKGRAEGYLS